MVHDGHGNSVPANGWHCGRGRSVGKPAPATATEHDDWGWGPEGGGEGPARRPASGGRRARCTAQPGARRPAALLTSPRPLTRLRWPWRLWREASEFGECAIPRW
ncbi:hypothetical protein E2562_010962 [Oryza meyeriana var. granulata]|uniref:Uncharacterized protein n=1 Tax=Oryza meyeriana var. granulata TaxID=110450 RepID=A0A6G1BVW9_9ORYZ|nr:hypothetical protein E2562_010962 [Oryza meyeriana var. granulata]